MSIPSPHSETRIVKRNDIITIYLVFRWFSDSTRHASTGDCCSLSITSEGTGTEIGFASFWFERDDVLE